MLAKRAVPIKCGFRGRPDWIALIDACQAAAAEPAAGPAAVNPTAPSTGVVKTDKADTVRLDQ